MSGAPVRQRVVGIIGGIAPGSTVDYYRSIITEYRERTGNSAYPSILINSIDLARLLDLAGRGRLEELTDWLAIEIERLAQGGADVGLLASNTPHLVFDELARRSPIPLLSIVEATCDAAVALGLTSVGLLGTEFTMRGRFYPDVFARRGIAVRAPAEADLAFVHARYMQELIPGDFLPRTREEFLAIIGRLRAAGAEGILLAGTELPLLLRGVDAGGVPLLDTTRIHVSKAVDALIA